MIFDTPPHCGVSPKDLICKLKVLIGKGFVSISATIDSVGQC